MTGDCKIYWKFFHQFCNHVIQLLHADFNAIHPLPAFSFSSTAGSSVFRVTGFAFISLSQYHYYLLFLFRVLLFWELILHKGIFVCKARLRLM